MEAIPMELTLVVTKVEVAIFRRPVSAKVSISTEQGIRKQERKMFETQHAMAFTSTLKVITDKFLTEERDGLQLIRRVSPPISI